MKKILIPVDFSEYSYNACLFAIQIAKKYGSEIHLFHSYIDRIIYTESDFSTGLVSSTLINEQLLDIEKNAQNDLKKLYKTLNSQLIKENITNIKIKYSLNSGETDSTIINFCKEYTPDIIIMGSSGKSKKGLLMGSVSKKIMNNAKIPVLAIPEIYFPTDISNILYMTDFEETDELIISKIFSLFKKLNIEIYCVHFNIFESKILKNEEQMEKLKSIISKKHKTENIKFKLIDSFNINQDIETFIKTNNINLIAFHSHKRNYFKELFTKKLTKKHLFHTNVPLLSLNV